MAAGRRDFLKNSGVLTTGALTGFPFDFFESKPLEMNLPADFQVRFHATNWGFQGSMSEFCEKAKREGYDGIEVWAPREAGPRDELIRLIREHGLDLGLLVGVGDRDPAVHARNFQEYLREASQLKPVYINCHSGRDYFSLDQNRPILEGSFEVEAATGIPVYHETHRARCLYSAPIAKQFLDAFPKLRLTLDISHWTNVHESMLEDQEATVQLALGRTHHIHSRIGHQEGPQVNDPRAPEWEAAVITHLYWWDQVILARSREGKPSFTVLTEFGPPNYLPAMPYTRMPLADQWEINLYMMNLLRKRWQSQK